MRKDTDYEGTYFHIIGACFFVASVIFAIICFFVTTFHKNNQVASFGSLFALFLFCISLCLFLTYCLGARDFRNPNDDPTKPTKERSFFDIPNTIILLMMLVEWFQMLSFSFHEDLRWVHSTSVHYINYVAAPFGPTHYSFQILYWIMFALAFSPYAYVGLIHFIIFVMKNAISAEASEDFIHRYQKIIYSSLLFLVTCAYFPVLSLLFAALDCDFGTSPKVLEYDHDIRCFKNRHIAMFACSLVGIVVFYPAASFAQAQAQTISDMKFSPRFVYVQLLVKFVLVVLATFLRHRSFWAYISMVLLANLAFFVLSFWTSTCPVRWVRRTRMVLYGIGCWVAIAAMIAHEVSSAWVPLFLLLFGAFVTACAVVGVCLLYDFFLKETEWMQLAEKLLTSS